MKVMVIVKATARSEAGLMPDEKLLTEMGKFNQELAAAGIMLSGEGLQPSSKGVRVRFSGTNRTLSEGPFPATNELVAGFWMWRVQSMAEAIEWVKRCPNPMITDSDIEIRPIFESEDFGEALKPVVREQEVVSRAKSLGLIGPRFENGKELLIGGLQQTYMFVSRSNIPSQWSRFASYLGRIPGQVGQVAYGVCSEKVGGGFEYISGVELSKTDGLPAELTTLRMAPSRYAVFVHEGQVADIPKTMDTICKQWLPESGLKAAAAPCFEKYAEQFNPMAGIEIWIPLQS